MKFIVQEVLNVDGKLLVNKDDVIKIATISREVIQGVFKGANKITEELIIERKGYEWVFDFDDIEAIEVVQRK